MFCLLCQKYNKCPYDPDVWNKNPCSRIQLQNILSYEKSAAHQGSVKIESESVRTVSVAGAINSSEPSDGIHEAFACLYFLVHMAIMYDESTDCTITEQPT